MRLFIFLLLQVMLFLPLTGLAATNNNRDESIIEKQEAREVTGAQKAAVIKTNGKLPLYFIKNKGQVDKTVSFYERGAGHATFFTEDGVVLSLTKRESKTNKPSFDEKILGLKGKNEKKTVSEAVSLSFVGANKRARITADKKMSGHVNYFIGKDKTKWRTGISTYGTVTYHDIYKNIDVKFYGNNKNIERDVIVRPGGDFSKAIFAYRGIKGLKVTEAGDLEVSLKDGKIIEQRPVIYQEIDGRRVVVEGAYRLLKGDDGTFTYGFTVAAYDHTKDLVIDPMLVYSTYLGGSSYDSGSSIALDSTGAVYVLGTTASTDFPLMNPMQGAYGGGFEDAFVTKINPAGTALVYSTYFGGSDYDYGNAIAVDSTGAVYATGSTRSTDFPLMNPIQGVLGGYYDAFVTKINPSGTALVYSTYFGGSGDDYGNAIAVDSTGAVYFGGFTDSTNFPLMNPIQGVFGGWDDAFIAKINPSGTALVYSTYHGGNHYDSIFDIAVDSTASVYVTGGTGSTNFPIMNPIQGHNAGGRGSGDAFITKINDATAPPPVLTLTLSPDVISIARGSSFGYGVTITNTSTTTTECFDYWENVTMPFGNIYPPSGDLFGWNNICLAAGATLSVHFTHGVPMNAPIGVYVFNAYVGTYQVLITSEDHFNFNVTAFNPTTKNPETSWRLIENGFRK